MAASTIFTTQRKYGRIYEIHNTSSVQQSSSVQRLVAIRPIRDILQPVGVARETPTGVNSTAYAQAVARFQSASRKEANWCINIVDNRKWIST